MENRQKILILATTASMIEQFTIHNIKILQSLGADVQVATNFKNPGTITSSTSQKLISKLTEMNVKCHQADFLRGVGTHKANKMALKEICNIIDRESITGIHAQSPLGGIIGRRAAHKKNIPIIYTAHGFQFYKNGPILDWLIFFPIEWFYAHWTNALITINQQDFSVAKYLPSKRRYMIHGVGIDEVTETRSNKEALRKRWRKKLGVNKNDYLIISVGELNRNKNHATVLKAISRINDPRIKYVIAGIGPERHNLIKLAKQLGLENRFRLLGYLSNLNGLYYAADLNVFVSKREGLGLGGLEGVARGLYIIGTRRTGMKDYIANPKIGLLIDSPTSSKDLSKKILLSFKEKRIVTDYSVVREFIHSSVDKEMTQIYKKEFFHS